MPWVILALLTALFESAKDVLSKERLRTVDAGIVAFAWRCFALPVLLPPLLFTGLPTLGPDFWWALLCGGVLNVITAILYMRAIQASDLSLTVPMLAFTPLFLLLTSPLILGEVPGTLGVAGVLLIVAGSYRLKAAERNRGILAPFRALIAERGPRLMLVVALIWSVSSNLDKIGVGNSSPLCWSVALNAFIAAALLPWILLHRRRGGLRIGGFKSMIMIGTAGGLGTLCQMTAVSLTMVPYVIAIKRTSTVWSSMWGHLRLDEPGMRERLPAVVLMLAGVMLITFD